MDAAGVVQLLRRRFLALLLCLLAGIAGALVLNHETQRVYESKSQVFVNIPTSGNVQSSVQSVLLTNDLLPSYAQLTSSHVVVTKVKDRLGLPESVDTLR